MFRVLELNIHTVLSWLEAALVLFGSSFLVFKTHKYQYNINVVRMMEFSILLFIFVSLIMWQDVSIMGQTGRCSSFMVVSGIV